MQAKLILCALFLACPHLGQAQLWQAGFDSVNPPALPLNWSTSGQGWATSTASESPGSGGANLAHTGSGPGAVILPSLNFSSAASGYIEYLARRTSSYEADSLMITASIDGGSTWPIVIAGAGGLPLESGSWSTVHVELPDVLFGQPDARLSLVALGGASGGSNMRIDDIEVYVESPAEGEMSELGFATPTSMVRGDTKGWELPIRLSLGEAGLAQGFQADVNWSSSALEYVGLLRGPSVLDENRWILETERMGTSLRVLLLAKGDDAITAADVDPLLLFAFDVASASSQDTVHVVLSNPVVASASSSGASIPVSLNPGTATVIITPRAGILSAPSAVALGEIYADEIGEAHIQISNESATDSLVVDFAAFDQPGWSVSPTSAVVEPLGETTLTITFVPLPDAAGTADAQLIMSHHGEETTVAVTASVLPTRGDVDGDRSVDVLDVVYGVDAVLGRMVPSTEAARRLDLYPFPSGDGELDVRDLTVLVRAIVSGQWLDAHPLKRAESLVTAGKHSEAAGLSLRTQGGDLLLVARLTAEVRALQAELMADRPLEAMEGFLASVGSVWVGALPDGIRLVWVSLSGRAIQPGEYVLAKWPATNSPLGGRLRGRGFSVTGQLQRDALEVEASTSLPRPADSGAPYPNPFRPGREVVQFPKARTENPPARWRVVDVLGREIWYRASPTTPEEFRWAGRDRAGGLVPSGLYFIQRITGTAVRSYPLLVTR